MEDSLFVKGLVVGFCLAAPVGPIAALCVQRTITQGWPYGIASGLGAALADAIYGTLAAFGASYISQLLMTERSVLQRVGGAILIVLGVKLFLTKPPNGKSAADGKSLFGDFLSTLALTLTNPMTFVAFAAVFTGFGIHAVRGHMMVTAELVVGVFAGSLLWWAILCGGAHALRGRFNYSKLMIANRATGVFVMLVGVVYLVIGVRP